jgi:hypothetical protein
MALVKARPVWSLETGTATAAVATKSAPAIISVVSKTFLWNIGCLLSA